ncbi:MAG: hypothetical protein Ct9H300mP19_00150 [Dehalococcoidia bacterium]|nr:MAG: hypothetical protein Ct9H300mP19_00150 [Dehalococcoidia bacterium]
MNRQKILITGMSGLIGGIVGHTSIHLAINKGIKP